MKKFLYLAFIYTLFIMVIRLIFIPEKYLYGHDHDYKIFEFLLALVVFPAIISLVYYAKTLKKDNALGLGILFGIFGFLGLIGSTFVEKTRVSYELNKNGISTKGVIDETYLHKTSSRSSKIYYQFYVKFTDNQKSYYSLPGSTDEEIYKIGDSIAVTYLARNPYLNKIAYKKEL